VLSVPPARELGFGGESGPLSFYPNVTTCTSSPLVVARGLTGSHASAFEDLMNPSPVFFSRRDELLALIALSLAFVKPKRFFFFAAPAPVGAVGAALAGELALNVRRIVLPFPFYCSRTVAFASYGPASTRKFLLWTDGVDALPLLRVDVSSRLATLLRVEETSRVFLIEFEVSFSLSKRTRRDQIWLGPSLLV